MKYLLFILIIIIGIKSYSQRSNYYSVDINKSIDAKVSQKVDLSGNININNNISTIDYGALALANAQNEKNRLENQKYIDKKEKNISLAIAENPVLAYDYGTPFFQEINKKNAKERGFKKFSWGYRTPHKSLFIFTNNGRWQNVSSENVTAEVIFNGPIYNEENDQKWKEIEKNALANYVKEREINEGLSPTGESVFVHKKDLNRATIFGLKGFVSTVIWEDDYQYTITDNYSCYDQSVGNGFINTVKVRYYGDKDEITFEQLEGRKYYLKRLIEKIISSGVITKVKY
ncbi:hypothetical protein OAE12_00640 [bacterium]|nr:hypothetical protein [bacterium]